MPVPQQGLRRIQYISAVRGDKLCTFKKDLGPSMMFPGAAPFNFWAGGAYSVGEATEQANWLRESKAPDQREPTNIGVEYLKQKEELTAQKKHKSVFGPNITVVRN